MRSDGLSPRELRIARNARLLCAGRLPIAIWFPLMMLACGLGVLALTAVPVIGVWVRRRRQANVAA